MEIYAYGNVEAIVGVLHYLVMIFGSSDYLDIIRTVLIVGFIVAACASVMQMTHRGWTWLLTVMVVYSICFIPKTSVLVTDKLSIEPPAAVANVPWLAGLLFSVKSQIGHTLVRLSETALQTVPDPRFRLPAELSYEQHGLMFGNRLIHESRTASIPDTQLRADIIAYVRNCVYPEVGKSLNPDAVARSTDLWASIAVTNPALVTTYTPLAAVMQVSPCPDVYALISARLPAQGIDMLRTFAANLFPGVPIATAVSNIGPALEAAYVKASLSTAATTASEHLLHNAVINHFTETGQVMASSSSDPAAVLMSLARSQATAQTNASYMLQARMGEQASPIIRNILEITLLAFFPVVFLMLLVTEGRRTMLFIVGYLYALIWIELWPFTYAILNYVQNMYAAKEIAAAGFVNPGSAVTLLTSSIVYSTALSTSAVAGWMIIAVPTLSAALLWGFDKIVGAVPSVSAMLGGAGQTASAAAVGNVSQNNLSFDRQLLSPQRTSAYFSSVQDDRSGDTRIFGVKDGVSAVEMLANTSYFAGSLQSQQATRLSEQASRSQEVASQQTIASTQETMAGLGDALVKGKSRASIQELGKVVSNEEARNDAKTWSETDRVANETFGKYSLSQSERASLAISAKAGIGIQPLLAAGIAGQLSKQQQESLQRDYASIQTSSSSEDVRNARELAQRLSANESYRNAVLSNQEDRSEITSRFERAVRFGELAQASLTERDSLTQQAEIARTRAISLGYDPVKDPRFTAQLLALRDAIRRGDPNSQTQLLTLQTYMDSWGSLSRPNQYLDGSMSTTSPLSRFGEIRTQDSQFADSTVEQNALNRRGIGPLNNGDLTVPSRLLSPTNQPMTAGSVLDAERRLQGTVAEKARQLKSEINPRDGMDGQFGTNRPLSNNVVDAFGRDIKQSNVNLLLDVSRLSKQLKTKDK